MTSSDSVPPLVSLSPSDTLVFRLDRNSNSKSTLKVSNISSQPIVFKVKTTQPSWYYVRPNQNILNAGESEDIAIVLVESECNRFLDQIAANKIDKLDKHRFLVQSTELTVEDHERLSSIPVSSRNEEYAKLWDASEKDKKNIKLKVEFQYDDSTIPKSKSPEKSSVVADTENIRNKIGRVAADSNSSNITSATENVIQDNIKSEYEILKKKYDAVVEYTVHLTAERDTIVTQLEEAQKDLSREITKRRIASSTAGDNNSKQPIKGGKISEKVEPKGFSLMTLLIVAFLFFAVGRYLHYYKLKKTSIN